MGDPGFISDMPNFNYPQLEDDHHIQNSFENLFPLPRPNAIQPLRVRTTSLPPLRPDFPLIMPEPITVTLTGFRYKYHISNLYFTTMKSAFTQELQVYPATTFPTFEHVIRQRLRANRYPSEIEAARREPETRIFMRIKFAFRETREHASDKEMAVTADRWETIVETLKEGRGRSFLVDYAVG